MFHMLGMLYIRRMDNPWPPTSLSSMKSSTPSTAAMAGGCVCNGSATCMTTKVNRRPVTASFGDGHPAVQEPTNIFSERVT